MFACKGLTYQYPESAHPAVADVTLEIEAGEFVLVLGGSGSGKSTFLRALNGLVPRFYGGSIAGEIRFQGKALSALSHREIVAAIGFVQQDPERQLVMESVERELAFGLENVAMPPDQIKSRLAEVSHLFGLGAFLSKQTSTLSGGEKQRVALASVLALHPQALLLDEPTSQLDPVHAEELLHAVRRLNEEWGMTVIMSEHRLDRCFHLADRILLFQEGKVVFNGSPRQFAARARDHAAWQLFLPPVSRYALVHGDTAKVPLTVKEARAQLCGSLPPAVGSRVQPVPPAKGRMLEQFTSFFRKAKAEKESEPLLRLQGGHAGYENNMVLTDISYAIYPGDQIALLGENGAGKSTLAKVCAGAVPLRKGSLYWQGEKVEERFWEGGSSRVGYLSQNPNDYFLHDTVEEELSFAAKGNAAWQEELLESLHLGRYRHRHPHDLSGGERQRLALAIVLATRPQLLLLDEPTRGLDQGEKEGLIRLLRALPVQATLVITHDVEFAAAYANRVSILYRGEIVADDRPEAVFAQSFYYMPQVCKLLRNHHGCSS
ncbi:ATP-binding cassette domain-containing protein [Brevibacillus sp. SYP-B805]|uniref:ABC transporter ATP-binding protein n=1 Tax=Brevibacillus sp. SYP-B805 TaxID=1578199 RepID=UPI001F49B017|nr:ATP-binding cassette domain-containing protein [Brevibacillus sp. SYP-B805]